MREGWKRLARQAADVAFCAATALTGCALVFAAAWHLAAESGEPIACVQPLALRATSRPAPPRDGPPQRRGNVERRPPARSSPRVPVRGHTAGRASFSRSAGGAGAKNRRVDFSHGWEKSGVPAVWLRTGALRADARAARARPDPHRFRAKIPLVSVAVGPVTATPSLDGLRVRGRLLFPAASPSPSAVASVAPSVSPRPVPSASPSMAPRFEPPLRRGVGVGR